MAVMQEMYSQYLEYMQYMQTGVPPLPQPGIQVQYSFVNMMFEMVKHYFLRRDLIFFY